MFIMIRGHIRDSFQTNQLYNLIKTISQRIDIKLYIHTWNIIQSNLSWRKLDKIEYPVNEDMIRNYFKDLNRYIVEIIIDDDSSINLEGDVNGFVSMTKTPKRGWKNMWYGKKRLIDSISRDIVNMKEIIVNIRFDVFTNSHGLSNNFILNFIEENKNNTNKIKLISDHEIFGIDNFYLGTLNAMFNLIYNFHFNLDNILSKHKVENQEFLVFRENKLFNSIIRNT